MSTPIVLASRSPQRRAILEQLGLDFLTVAPDVEEVTAGAPAEVVVENALRKARAVARGLHAAPPEAAAGEPIHVDPDSGGRGSAPGREAPAARVLGVDTAVVAGGRVYGKPRDEPEARSFLEALSGHDHEVWSGMALLTPGTAGSAAGRATTAASRTTVRFRALDTAELDWYLASGEWRQRAGAYAIQGRGAALVERIEGDYWTVVGLPVPELVRAARDLFAK